MCLIVFAWRPGHALPLLVTANRDEFYARPAAALAPWDDVPGLVAGRDLQAGGTWLGVSGSGFGLVTNLRVAGYPKPDMASRGRLITDWLQGASPNGIEAMNPFNLWLAGPESLRFVSNYPDPHEVELEPGIHGLSNGARGDRWFKTAQLEDALAIWLAEDKPATTLFDALADETPESVDPEDAFSSVFIRNPTYGTRCSTVVLIDADGNGQISERRFDPHGECVGENALNFFWPV